MSDIALEDGGSRARLVVDGVVWFVTVQSDASVRVAIDGFHTLQVEPVASNVLNLRTR